MTDKRSDDRQKNEAQELRSRVHEWKKLRFEARGMRTGKKISVAGAVLMGGVTALDIALFSGSVSVVFSLLFAMKAGEHTADAVIFGQKEKDLGIKLAEYTRDLRADLKKHNAEKRRLRRRTAAPPVSALLKLAGQPAQDFSATAKPPQKKVRPNRTPFIQGSGPRPPEPPQPAL